MEELQSVVGSWILGWLGFYPFGEVVHCYDDVVDLAWTCWQRSNEIHPPHVEGPGWLDDGLFDSRSMWGVSILLAFVALL